LCGVVVDTNADATSIGRNVVNPVRDGFPELLVNKIMDFDLVRTIVLRATPVALDAAVIPP